VAVVGAARVGRPLASNPPVYVAGRTCRRAQTGLPAARARVVEDPAILGGTPVVKGTRVPVHDLAASVAAGLSRERILSAYPGLDAETLDLVVLYAEAHPARGRPRRLSVVAPDAGPNEVRTVARKRQKAKVTESAAPCA